MHEHNWSEERSLTDQKHSALHHKSLGNDKFLLIRWDMKAPYHNDHAHIEHEKKMSSTLSVKCQDPIYHCYELKDLCNAAYSGDLDLLFLHTDEIKEHDKRPDVIYHYIDFATAKAQDKMEEWDLTAIKKILITLDIQL